MSDTPELTDERLKDMAHAAFEEAMAYGVSADSFIRLAKTVRAALAAVRPVGYIDRSDLEQLSNFEPGHEPRISAAPVSEFDVPLVAAVLVEPADSLGAPASPTGPLALQAEPCGLGASPSVPGAEVERLMRELKALVVGRSEWRVVTPDERGIIMWFTRDDSTNPQREAEMWLADRKRGYPAQFADCKVTYAVAYSEIERKATELLDALARGGATPIPNAEVMRPHAAARGMEARSGETEGLDPKGDSPVGNADAPRSEVEVEAGVPVEAMTDERAALRSLLDMFHGGHITVRPEAAGAWLAAVDAGEAALSSAPSVPKGEALTVLIEFDRKLKEVWDKEYDPYAYVYGWVKPAWEAALAAPAQATQAEAPVVTDAMVDAYLKANDAYWKRTDEMPKPPGKWRAGTVGEATRVSLEAALAALPSQETKP